MTCRMREIVPGTHIRDACVEAINLADMIKEEVEFEFNGVILTVEPKKDRVNELMDQYETKRREWSGGKA